MSYFHYALQYLYLALQDEVRLHLENTKKNKFSLGDRLESLTPGEVGKAFVAEQLYDEEMSPISAVPHPGMRFYVFCPHALREGDILRAGE